MAELNLEPMTLSLWAALYIPTHTEGAPWKKLGGGKPCVLLPSAIGGDLAPTFQENKSALDVTSESRNTCTGVSGRTSASRSRSVVHRSTCPRMGIGGESN